jgi:hypothetical protein
MFGTKQEGCIFGGKARAPAQQTKRTDNKGANNKAPQQEDDTIQK